MTASPEIPAIPAGWADSPFDAGALLAHGPDDAGLREALAVFCAALEGEARLTSLGRWATHRYLDRLMEGRRRIDRWFADDPATAAEIIAEPVILIGAPRTGTTVTHRLLRADPRHRVPEGWELLMPAPPPEPATFDTDPRIAEMADELTFPQRVAGTLTSIHTYSARMPKECLSAMAFSGRTEEFISRYHVPSYVDWLRTADTTPAYEAHRRVLQVLQRRMPTRRWVLKSPVHLQAIPTLVATYPDARYVVTHRDPGRILASVSSLIATMRSAFSDQVDPAAIGRYHLDLYARSLDRLVDHVDGGVLPADRTVHLTHAALLDDPLAAMGRVYTALGLDLDAATRDGMAAELATAQDDGAGAHRYDLADYEIDADEATAAFARYRARFLEDIP